MIIKKSKKIHVEKSKMQGYGLFATKDIKKGENIFIIKGKKVKFLINNIKQAKIAGLNWVGTGKNEWIDPMDYCVFFNHSCNPNSILRGKVLVEAMRNIKKGEEVVFDYSLNEADIYWQIKCNCKSKNCRKVIKSIQFLPSNIFKKHKYHISKYYQKVYDKFNASKFKSFKELEQAWLNFIEKDF